MWVTWKELYQCPKLSSGKATVQFVCNLTSLWEKRIRRAVCGSLEWQPLDKAVRCWEYRNAHWYTMALSPCRRSYFSGLLLGLVMSFYVTCEMWLLGSRFQNQCLLCHMPFLLPRHVLGGCPSACASERKRHKATTHQPWASCTQNRNLIPAVSYSRIKFPK